MSLVSYVKTIWKAGKSGGTPITPDNLNKIEDGIEAVTEDVIKLNSNLFKTIKRVSTIPTFDDSCIIHVIDAFECGGVEIPAYSKGLYLTLGGNNDAVLIVIDSTAHLYVVYRNGITWREGKQLGNPTAIASGTDINSLTTIGLYTSQSFANAPISYSAILEVQKCIYDSVTVIVQTLTSTEGQIIYKRRKQGTNDWESWYKYIGTKV